MALRAVLGTVVNISNSALTMLSYVFIPRFLGIEQIEYFLVENLYPSIIVLVFSVGIPNYVKKSEEILFVSFLTILVSIAYVFSLNYLWYSNLFWIIIGVISQKELIKGNFNVFALLVLSLSVTNFAIIIISKDWRLAHLLSPVIVLLVYSIFVHVNKISIVNLLLKGLNQRFNPFNTFSKILSISLLWWIISWRYKLESESLYNLSVYQKVTLSIPVAVLGFVSLVNFFKDRLSWGWIKDSISLVVAIVISFVLSIYFDNISWILLSVLIFGHVPVVYLQNKLLEEKFYPILYIPFSVILVFINLDYLLISLAGFLILIRLCLYVQNRSGSTPL